MLQCAISRTFAEETMLCSFWVALTYRAVTLRFKLTDCEREPWRSASPAKASVLSLSGTYPSPVGWSICADSIFLSSSAIFGRDNDVSQRYEMFCVKSKAEVEEGARWGIFYIAEGRCVEVDGATCGGEGTSFIHYSLSQTT